MRRDEVEKLPLAHRPVHEALHGSHGTAVLGHPSLERPRGERSGQTKSDYQSGGTRTNGRDRRAPLALPVLDDDLGRGRDPVAPDRGAEELLPGFSLPDDEDRRAQLQRHRGAGRLL